MAVPNDAEVHVPISKGKFFLLTYYQSPRDLNLRREDSGPSAHKWRVGTRPMESQLHKVRDGLASGMLISLLHEEGYKYAGPILNLPETVVSQLNDMGEIRQSDVSASGADIALLATRPPINDSEGYTKRYILRSNSAFEKSLFKELEEHFFSECSRENVSLMPGVELPETHEDLRSVSFRESRGALVAKETVHCGSDETVAYMLSTGPIHASGSRLVAAFGLGGTETLLFAHLIRTDREFGLAFRDILTNGGRRIALGIFKVPRAIPSPYLFYDPGILKSRIVHCEKIE